MCVCVFLSVWLFVIVPLPSQIGTMAESWSTVKKERWVGFRQQFYHEKRIEPMCFFMLCVCENACACLPEPPPPRTRLPGVDWNNRGAESETEPVGIRCDHVSARWSKKPISLSVDSPLFFFLAPLRSLKDRISSRAEWTGPLWQLVSSQIKRQRLLATFWTGLHTLAPSKICLWTYQTRVKAETSASL